MESALWRSGQRQRGHHRVLCRRRYDPLELQRQRRARQQESSFVLIRLDAAAVLGYRERQEEQHCESCY